MSGAHLKTALALSSGLLATAISAQPTSSVTPQQLSSLLIQALTDPKGEAHGVMTGAEAEALRKRFGATGPLRVDVRTVTRLPQSGCARLEMTFAQDNVKLPSAPAARSQSVAFSLNYCLNGRPPGTTP